MFIRLSSVKFSLYTRPLFDIKMSKIPVLLESVVSWWRQSWEQIIKGNSDNSMVHVFQSPELCTSKSNFKLIHISRIPWKEAYAPPIFILSASSINCTLPVETHKSLHIMALLGCPALPQPCPPPWLLESALLFVTSNSLCVFLSPTSPHLFVTFITSTFPSRLSSNVIFYDRPSWP